MPSCSIHDWYSYNEVKTWSWNENKGGWCSGPACFMPVGLPCRWAGLPMQIPMNRHLEHPCTNALEILNWCCSLLCFLNDMIICLYSAGSQCLSHSLTWEHSHLHRLYSSLSSNFTLAPDSHFRCHRSHQKLHLPDCSCFRQLCFQAQV